jgi:hypothetical protein
MYEVFMKRSTYAQTTEAKIRFGRLEFHFLRAMATLHGVALSEMVRRFVADAMTRYSERGLYKMEVESDEAPAERALGITIVRGDTGTLRVRFPDGLSDVLRDEIQDTLSRHLKELNGLVASRPNGKTVQVEGKAEGDGGEGSQGREVTTWTSHHAL